MSNLPPTASREDIEEELDFTDVLIESLDTGADDYQSRSEELENTKRDLTARLAALQGAAPPVNSQGNFNNAARLEERASHWQTTLGSSPGSTSSQQLQPSASSNQIAQSGSRTTSAGSKRPFPGGHFSASSEHNSKRATPDPGTPNSSTDSFELIENPSAELKERAKQRQLAVEADLKHRRERQKADEQFARSFNQHPPSSAASSSRNDIQTTIGRGGAFQRPPPPPKPEPPSYGTQHMAGPSQPPFSQYAGQQSPFNPPSHRIPPVKSESAHPGRELAQRPRQTAVVDLTGDDDDSEDFQPAPRPSHHSFNSPQTNLSTPMYHRNAMMAQNARQPNSHLYPVAGSSMGNPYAPGSSNSPMASSSNGYLTNAARGVFDTARNLIPGSLTGSLTELHNLMRGHSTNPLMVGDDDDDDDVIYGGYQRRAPPNFGVYNGQRDLYNDRYDAFASHDPAKTKEEIDTLLQNIRPDEDMPAHLRVQTPAALNIRLHKYQELGLTWLQKCEEGSNKGGILADDMGLGKTIQMLSLIVTHKSEDPNCRTTLVVAPVALMRQWKQEIEQKVKPGPHRLSVFIHHGATKKKRFNDLKHFDVVLTTYGSLAAEVKRLEAFRLREKHNPGAQPNDRERCALISSDARWYRVILDEAQCIKNKSTQTAKGSFELRATYRFCMTGTPMMNSVEELYSLVKFLRIRPYSGWEKFRMDFVQPLRSSSGPSKDNAMRKLQTLCKAVMLRRTKQSEFEGQPILVLPERTTHVENPEFSDDEMNFYQALEQRTQLQFNKYLKAGTVGKSYSAILVLLLRLRQACCHPHLIRDFGVSAAADVSPELLIELAGELSDQVVARIKERQGNFECPVCYDAATNPAIFIPCGHDTCSDCFSKITDPANAIANGNDGAAPTARCPNCRAIVDPKRITDWDSFKKVHQQDLLTEQELAAMTAADVASDSDDDSDDSDDSVGDDKSDSDSDSEDDVKSESGSLNGFVVNDDVEDSETESEDENLPAIEAGPSAAVKSEVKNESGDDGLAEPEATTSAAPAAMVKYEGKGKGKAREEDTSEAKLKLKSKKDKKKKKDKAKKSKQGKGKEKKKSKTAMTLAEMKKMGNRNASARKKYLRMIEKDWVTSAKIEKTLELLQKIMDDTEDGGEKVLIFSQWTSLLDLLEVPVDRENWGYRRYDGSMNARARGDAVDDFRDPSKNVRIMLISLKAGNAGLNLNMASRVIILDPFWNPYIEEQAIDRAHRIGQSRPVQVHRILVKDTVEDRIIELQNKKRELISQALDEKAGQSIARLGVRELAYLFGVPAGQ